MAKGLLHFNNDDTLEYKDCETKYTDNGIIFSAEEGKIFVPYGGIKFITEE